MSLAAARAMDDLADCLDEEATELPPGNAYATLAAMARAHRKCAKRIRARAEAEIGGPMEVPEEYREKPGQRRRR